MIRLNLMFFIFLSACASKPDPTKLKGHLNEAAVASNQTGQHISHVRTRLETIDYKSSRAKELLDKGFAK
jgi:hypothetical protein